MEADKNGTGEGVKGCTTNLCSQPARNGRGDFTDSLVGSIPKPSERSKVVVHQPKYAQHYNMSHSRRGFAVIFNHEHFDPGLDLDRRVGTKVDCENLKATLTEMDFDVVIHEDLRLNQIEDVVDELAATDFTDCDCLLLVVLSHGARNAVYAKNTIYSTNILFDRFTPDKCPSLAGKPKMFILQACQGTKLDSGIDVECDSPDAENTYRMPLFADFLFAYSTLPGYYSWRNEGRGSWFIESLCSELNQRWKTDDLTTILTFVNQRVAVDYTSKNHELGSEWKNDRKQTSTFTCQLTRILKFHPKTVENNGTSV